MKLLVVTQYFWPESFLINDFVATLESQGYEVDVLTGKPNYPEGRLFPGYAAEGCMLETYGDRIGLFRIPLRPRGAGGAVNLARNYLSFILNGLRYSRRILGARSYDAILVFAPSPITSAIPAIYLKWKYGSHLAIWVQDLWPESLSATGFVRNKAILAVVGWFVQLIYRCTDTLLVQSRAFIAPVSRFSNPDKVVYFPNCYLEPGSRPATQLPPWLLDTLERHFCVVFAGNVGSAQSIETLVAAAERLRPLGDVRIVIVGSGSMSRWLEEQRNARQLNNLVIAGRFPADLMPHLFARAQALLVTLKNEEPFDHTVPSKVQAYLASGRPIVAALNGEGARVIEDANAGLTCSAEDAEGLASCIERLYRMPLEDRDRFGRSGRAYFAENFDMKKQAERLVDILSSRIRERESH